MLKKTQNQKTQIHTTKSQHSQSITFIITLFAKTAAFVQSSVWIYPACLPLPHPTPPHPLPSTAVILKGAAEALRDRDNGCRERPRYPNLPRPGQPRRMASLLPKAPVPGRPGCLPGPWAAAAHHRPTKPRPMPGLRSFNFSPTQFQFHFTGSGCDSHSTRQGRVCSEPCPDHLHNKEIPTRGLTLPPAARLQRAPATFPASPPQTAQALPGVHPRPGRFTGRAACRPSRAPRRRRQCDPPRGRLRSHSPAARSPGRAEPLRPAVPPPHRSAARFPSPRRSPLPCLGRPAQPNSPRGPSCPAPPATSITPQHLVLSWR